MEDIFNFLYGTSLVSLKHNMALEQEIQKIDRLSNLPNELLDLIFDYAYPLGSPSTGPLSKRLLPYHITGTYRRIYLDDYERINRLIRKINREPHLGRLVKVAHLISGITYMADGGEGVDDNESEEFFGHLENLEELDLGNESNISFEWLCLVEVGDAFSGHLPSLRHLCIAGTFCLSHFAHFTSLISLDLTHHWPVGAEPNNRPWDEEYLREEIKWQQFLPNLKTLSLHDLMDARYATILPVFFELAPNVTELTLSFAEEVLNVDWALLVNSLPSNLIKLDLFDLADLPINHLLPRFSHLERLFLSSTLDSANLPSHLIHLRCLRTLELQLEHTPADRLLPLFTGPSRLENLQEIIIDASMFNDLDLSGGTIGRRLKVNYDGSIREGTILEAGGLRLNEEDWELPTLSTDAGDIWSVEGARKVKRVARKRGIKVGGDLPHLLKKAEVCLLEIANNVIYRSFRDKNLQYIDDFKALHPDLSRRFPRIDTETLDPDNLRLIRKDFPVTKWFMLSLSN